MTYALPARSLVTAGLAMLVIAGCNKKEAAPTPVAEAPAAAPAPTPPAAPSVASIDLGSSIDTATKKVAAPSTEFGKKDVIYASVSTAGVGTAVPIAAVWTYGDKGQKVNESGITVDLTGPATHEFHISKKTPWPAGKYKVEISIGGASAGTKEFEVK